MESIESLTLAVRRAGTARILGVVAVSLLGIAGLWSLVVWGSAPAWVPLIRDAPAEVVSESGSALDEAAIPYRLARGGTEIEVREEDVARARVRLAQQGVPRDGRRGFELFDENNWGMTDFTQRVNYRRALEGELERTISQMRGVRSAKVHLALREGSIYQRQDRPVEASVLLGVVSGARPTSEQVEAIRYLLASAVDGLTSENVSVLDDSGRVLSAATEPEGSLQADRRQLELQREVESYLETRASELVEPMLGAANVRIRVSALLDTERVERRIDAVDPNAQVLTAEERSEIEPGDPSQGAASTIQHNTFDVTRSTEVSLRPAGAIRRLTVAIALNEDAPRARDPEITARVEALVANAVGLDSGRGDAITVVAVPFEPVLSPEIFRGGEPGPRILDVLRDFQRPIVIALALLMTFGLAFRALGLMRADMRTSAVGRLGSSGGAGAGVVVGAAPVLNGQLEREPGSRDPLAVGSTVDASRLVRAWLSEG